MCHFSNVMAATLLVLSGKRKKEKSKLVRSKKVQSNKNAVSGYKLWCIKLSSSCTVHHAALFL